MEGDENGSCGDRQNKYVVDFIETRRVVVLLEGFDVRNSKMMSVFEMTVVVAGKGKLKFS